MTLSEWLMLYTLWAMIYMGYANYRQIERMPETVRQMGPTFLLVVFVVLMLLSPVLSPVLLFSSLKSYLERKYLNYKLRQLRKQIATAFRPLAESSDTTKSSMEDMLSKIDNILNKSDK
jgi:predicted PurR-regulated permease PerM